MRFLIDEDVDVRLIGVLRQLGHNARRVPSGTKNGAVARLAQAEGRILISRDADFTDESRYPPSRYAGLIHVDIHPPRLPSIAAALKALLAGVPEAGFAGRLFVLDETGYSDFSSP